MSQNGGQANATSDILLAGAFAAFTIDLLVYPLDTIKTRLQSQNYATRYIDASTKRMKPVFWRGLYQGIGGVILATLPSSGAFFLTYETTKRLTTSTSLPVPLSHAISSAIAELVSCALLTPAEVIKQNAQMVSTSPSSSFTTEKVNVTLNTLKQFKSRPSRLFRGYTALAARNLPFTAMQFPLYEALRDRIQQRRKDQGKWTGTIVESTIITGCAAGVAGSFAAVVTTPVDVVKTRVMLAAADEGDKDGGKKRVTEVSAAKDIWREGGMKGLFRGAMLRGVWTILGSGLYLGVYDMGRVYLARRRGVDVKQDDLM